ncbi:MAG TPA: DMT family transporter [Chthonomonadaceae bacterium]|nr:DMT family transporter [Chthonomonadaceae bacterium]
MKGLLLLAFTAGAVLAVQSVVNARLGEKLGNPTMAGLASFIIGLIGLLFYLLATRTPLPASATLLRVPLWAWTGGLLGALYVVVTIVTVPRIGVGALTGLVIGGQITLSIVLDHFGLLGLERHPISLGRLAGAALLLIGVFLVKRF